MSLLLKPTGGNTRPLALFDVLTNDFEPTAAAAATLSVVAAIVGVVAVERAVGHRTIRRATRTAPVFDALRKGGRPGQRRPGS